MGVGNKLETALIEKAAPSAFKLVDNMTKGIVPTNKVSVFIEESMPGLFEFEGCESITKIMAKMMIAGSNKEPQESARRLLVLYEQLGEFFRDVSGKIEDAEIVEEEPEVIEKKYVPPLNIELKEHDTDEE